MNIKEYIAKIKSVKREDLSDEDIFYILGLALFGMALIVAPLYYMGIFIPSNIFPLCPFHLITGFSCPGCGSTRAVTSLLHGHLLDSIKYNPGIIYFVVFYIPFMVSHSIAHIRNLIYKKKNSVAKGPYTGMKLKPIYFYGLLGLLLVFFVVRIILEINGIYIIL